MWDAPGFLLNCTASKANLSWTVVTALKFNNYPRIVAVVKTLLKRKIKFAEIRYLQRLQKIKPIDRQGKLSNSDFFLGLSNFTAEYVLVASNQKCQSGKL